MPIESINTRVIVALEGISAPVFFGMWRKTSVYPTPPKTYITFQETLARDGLGADDVVRMRERYVLVDIWSAGDTATIAAAVDTAMRTAGFAFRGASDIVEEDTATYHRSTEWVLYEIFCGGELNG